MAPHSSTLAWKIPWTEGPGRLQSMGSLRVRHDPATSLSLFTFMHWRRKWQPTPVFLPGDSQAQGSLVGCHLWGRTESDTTDVTQQQQQQCRNTPLNERTNLSIHFTKVRQNMIQISGFKIHPRDSLGGPVVNTLPSNAGDVGSVPDRGTNILHATQLATEPSYHD